MMAERPVFSEHRKAMLNLGPLQTLRDLLHRVALQGGDDVLVVEKDGNEKICYTASQIYEDVCAVGTYLTANGFCGKNIVLLGENSYRWIVSFLAITCSGAVAVPLDRELTDADLCKLASLGDAQAVFCSETFAPLALQIAEQNGCGSVFLMGDEATAPDAVAWTSLVEQGQQLREQYVFADDRLQGTDVAAIVFTSGTTGFNKGVLLTHGNLASNINSVAQNVTLEDSTISVLPMNHIYELNCNILPMLYLHTVIYINDRMRNLMHNLRFFQPRMAVVVPLFLESFYNNIWQKFRKDGSDQRMKRLLAISNRLLESGIDLRRVIFKRLHSYFGSELKLIICGGAPVNQRYVNGLTELGFDIYVGYGLTEASPIAALNTNPFAHPDSVGQPFAQTRVHIFAPDSDGEGEIWLQGDNITAGYYKDDQATKDSFENGWFKTGDYGRFTSDGYLQVTGRKKNLIVLDNGKNVHPEEIEELIRTQLPYVCEVVVMETEKEIFGSRQKIIAAVLYVDSDAFPGLTSEEIEKITKKDMITVNEKLPGYKSVNHIFISADRFQKNSTKKVLRSKVIEQYGEVFGKQKTQRGGVFDV